MNNIPIDQRRKNEKTTKTFFLGSPLYAHVFTCIAACEIWLLKNVCYSTSSLSRFQTNKDALGTKFQKSRSLVCVRGFLQGAFYFLQWFF